MRIGVFEGSWWEAACAATGHETVALPRPRASESGELGTDNSPAHAADLAGRVKNGAAVASILDDNPVDLLLETSGAGLAFLADSKGGEIDLVHDAHMRPLLSHFIDPLVTAFQGLGWPTTWQCLQNKNWVKAVWDRAQVRELQDFGVPSVLHLPMAAPDRDYNTEPLDPSRYRPTVSFVGGQNTSYCAPDATVPSSSLFAGVLAQAVRGGMGDMTFYDVYHDLYHLGTPVQPDDPPETKIEKTGQYFNAKLFFNAALCIRNRDRFVVFLKQHVSDVFELIGNRWDAAYGLTAKPPLPTSDAYFNHFREVAINLNLVNGNAETGLNMRHFEITAAGGFMLCYDQLELQECFEVGKECAVFTSEKDLLDKIDYYLSHPDELVAVARAGQRRTLSQHLYSHRLEALLSAIRIYRPPEELAATPCEGAAAGAGDV